MKRRGLLITNKHNYPRIFCNCSGETEVPFDSVGTEKRGHTKYNLKDRGCSMPKGSLQYALSLPAPGRKVSGKSRYVRRTVNRGPQAKRDNSKRITACGLPIGSPTTVLSTLTGA